MSDKTTVTAVITAHDGTVHTISGDTVIAFAIKECDEFLKGNAKMIDANAAFIGNDIPDMVFPLIIGNLLKTMIEKKHPGNPGRASFHLHCVADILEKRSREIKDTLSPEDKVNTTASFLKDLFNSIFD